MKKAILSMILLAAGCISASAQEAKTQEVFNPHWYVRAQVGFQQTLGEISWSKLNSLNVQAAVGYDFTKVWGLRLTAGGWQSKGGSNLTLKGDEITYEYKWNYVAPTLNVTFNVTNAIWGYNPKRVVDFSIFAGGGANIAWKNDGAACVANDVRAIEGANMSTYMQYLWDGTKVRPVGQFGADIDFNLSRRVALGIEANWNFLSDKYNSKKAKNVDWYFNTLVGVKVNLGKVTKSVPVVEAEPKIIEKVIRETNTVHDTVYVDKEAAAEKIRRDVFFTICGSDISKAEQPKVDDIAAYLNRHKSAKVTVTGYADKGTGNAKLNKMYAERRARIVEKALIEKYGISKDRIIVDSKGDTEQPYDINDLNRVSICIAE